MNAWEFPYKIAADLSCVNKLLGLGNQKSRYFCYICLWNQNLVNGTSSGAEKRTFASIQSESKRERQMDRQTHGQTLADRQTQRQTVADRQTYRELLPDKDWQTEYLKYFKNQK